MSGFYGKQKMRKVAGGFILVLISLLVLVQTTQAQMGMMADHENEGTESSVESSQEGMSVDGVMTEILETQKMNAVADLDLSQINDDDWARLGDALMEQMHPGDDHEYMDEMMGGEGSETLREMHINMGRAYLRYGMSDDRFVPPRGMMGRSFGGHDGDGWQMSMHGGYAQVHHWSNSYLTAVCLMTLVSANLLLLSGAYFLFTRARVNVNGS